jgi:hypothetical protein
MLLKLAMMIAIPLYTCVAWLVCSQSAAPAADPGMIHILAVALTALYAVQLLVVEPLLSRQLMQRFGGYCQQVLVVRLAFFESGAVYGLLLTLLTHDMSYVCAFGGVALVMMLLRAPSISAQG